MADQRLMYIFERFSSLIAFLLTILPSPLRLRQRPNNILIKFCVDSVTCLETISQILSPMICFRQYMSKFYLQCLRSLDLDS